MGPTSEDCLTLNVWSPPEAAGLPILFFLHGGAFNAGSGTLPAYADDAELARSAVAVTINYPLGPRQPGPPVVVRRERRRLRKLVLVRRAARAALGTRQRRCLRKVREWMSFAACAPSNATSSQPSSPSHESGAGTPLRCDRNGFGRHH